MATKRTYRVLVLGHDGNIANRIDLFCANESNARERAKQLVVGLTIESSESLTLELWDVPIKIETFGPPRSRHMTAEPITAGRLRKAIAQVMRLALEDGKCTCAFCSGY